MVQLGWGCLWPERDPGGTRQEKPGENGQVPEGMGTARLLVWGHYITWCQQPGDETKHLGWRNGVSGAWERGRGCKWGGWVGLGGCAGSCACSRSPALALGQPCELPALLTVISGC